MEEDFREANKDEIKRFKKDYCKNAENRSKIFDDFKVSVNIFSESLPDKTYCSYATGEKEITGAYIIFEVQDLTKKIVYYPIFSEAVGRQMLKSQEQISIPKKTSIFLEETISKNSNLSTSSYKNGVKSAKVNSDASKTITLILFIYQLMGFHIEHPKKIYGILKELLDKFLEHPNFKPFPEELCKINNTLEKFLAKEINTKNEDFKSLLDFIDFIKKKYPECCNRMKNTDFSSLRDILTKRYGSTFNIYF